MLKCALLLAFLAVGATLYPYTGWYGLNIFKRHGIAWQSITPNDAHLPLWLRLHCEITHPPHMRAQSSGIR